MAEEDSMEQPSQGQESWSIASVWEEVAESTRREGRQEGRIEGRLLGLRRVLLLALGARGIRIDEATRARIEFCTKPNTLDRWAALAATIEVSQDDFGAKLRQLEPKVDDAAMSVADRSHAQGKLEAKVESVLLVLEARSVQISEETRARIMGASDADQLDDWLRRAAVSSDAGALFES